MVEQRDRTDEISHSLVIFRLANRDLAFLLERVGEILPMLAIKTAVSDWPAWLRGMINLRGRTLPVIDLRARLGLPARIPDPDPRSAIIIALPAERDPVAFIVDSVTGVRTLDEELEPVDELGGEDHAVLGIAHSEGQLLAVLDVGRLLIGSPSLEVLEHLS